MPNKFRTRYSTYIVIALYMSLFANALNEDLPIPLLTVIGAFFIVYFFMQNILYHGKTGIILLAFILITAVSSIIFQKDFSLNFKWLCNWILTLLIYNVYSYKSQVNHMLWIFQKNMKLTEFFNFAYAFFLLYVFTQNKYYQWIWNGKYLTIATTPHAVAAGGCMYISLVILYLSENKERISKYKRRLNYLYIAIGTCSVLMTGSRVFLLNIVSFMLILIYLCFRNQKQRITAFIFGSIGALIIFLRTSMADKFIEMINSAFTYNSVSETGLLGAITSRRTDFWLADVKEFFNYEPINLLVGKGFDHIFYVNLEFMGKFIWGHSDVIMTLVSAGLIGVLVYLYTMVRFMKNNIYDKFSEIIIFLYILLPLLLNGIMNYSCYLYSIIIMTMVIRNEKIREIGAKKSSSTCL